MGAEVGDLAGAEVAQPWPPARRVHDPPPAVGAVGCEREQAAAGVVPDPLFHLLAADDDEPQAGIGDRVADQPFNTEVLGGQRADDRHLCAGPGRDRCGQIAVAERADRDRRAVAQYRVVPGQWRPARAWQHRFGRAGRAVRDQPRLLHQAQRFRWPAHRTAQAGISLPGQRRGQPPGRIVQP